MLWPGLSVSTRLLVETLKQVIVVPEDAVQHGPNGLYAFVVGDDNKVAMQPIKVSQSGDGEVGRQQGLRRAKRSWWPANIEFRSAPWCRDRGERVELRLGTRRELHPPRRPDHEWRHFRHRSSGIRSQPRC